MRNFLPQEWVRKMTLSPDNIVQAARELIDRYGVEAAERASEVVRRVAEHGSMRERDMAMLVLNGIEKALAAK